MDSLFWRFLVMACALLASFFFSASEFAVIRLDRLKVRQAAEEGSRADRILAGFLADTGRFLSGISIGNTLANLLLSSFAAITFAPPLARRLVAADAGPGAEATAAALVTFVLSYAVLVFGEIAPKQAAMSPSRSPTPSSSSARSRPSRPPSPRASASRTASRRCCAPGRGSCTPRCGS